MRQRFNHSRATGTGTCRPAAPRALHRARRALAVCAIASASAYFLSGCVVPNQPFRLGQSQVSGPGYDLSYVEFDEMGDFWDRKQLAAAAHTIAADERPRLLVVYIHGWNNNASDASPDVKQFTCLLDQLASMQPTAGLRIHGVYLGWRGLSIEGGSNPLTTALFAVPHYLSFWSRKSAATRVAGTPVTETIFTLIRQTRLRNPQSRCVLVGHSFGALVLEKALAQAMIGGLLGQGLNAERPPAAAMTLYAPADLVLLVNPAAESIYAKEMVDLFRSYDVHAPQPGDIDPEHPLVVSLTSEGDWATGRFFPLGTRVATLFGRFRRYEQTAELDGADRSISQRYYFTHTPGHNPYVQSHIIAPRNALATDTQHQPAQMMAGCDLSGNPAFAENLRGPASSRFVTGQPGAWAEWEVAPAPQAGRPTPYWILRVPRQIIKNHGGIFEPNSRAFMAALFRITRMTEPAPQRSMQLTPAAPAAP